MELAKTLEASDADIEVLGKNGRHEELAAVLALHAGGVLEASLELLQIFLLLLHLLESLLQVSQGKCHVLIGLSQLYGMLPLRLVGILQSLEHVLVNFLLSGYSALL